MTKKFMIWLGVITIALVFGLIAFWTWGFSQLNRLENEASSKVGQSVVVGNDTLTIVDYSMFQSTYTLSNGTKVAFQYVDKK